MYTVKCKEDIVYDPRYGIIVISPKLDLALNTAGSLSFTMPLTHPCYDTLKPLESELIVYRDDVELWRGRVVSIDTDIFRQKAVACEGELAYLNDTLQQEARYYRDPAALLNGFLSEHNADCKAYGAGPIDKTFNAGIVRVVDEDISQFRLPSVKAWPNNKTGTGIIELSPKWLYSSNINTNNKAKVITPQKNVRYILQIASESYAKDKTFLWNGKEYYELNKDDYMFEMNFQTTLEAIQDLLVTRLNGYLRIRHANGKRYLDVLNGYVKDANQDIQFGVNLLDYATNLDLSDIYTAVVPLGPELPEWREISLEQSDDEKTQKKKNGLIYDKWTDNELNKIYTLPTKDGKFYAEKITTDSKGKKTYKYGREQTAWSNGLKTEIKNKGVDYSKQYNGYQSYRKRYKVTNTVGGRTVNYIPNLDNVKKYGLKCKVEYFEDCTTSSELTEKAYDWLSRQQFDDVSLEVKAIDFHLLDKDVVPFDLLDLVHVVAPIYGLDAKFPIDAMSISLDNPGDSTIGLNTTKHKTLTKNYVSTIAKKTSAKTSSHNPSDTK